MARHAGKRLTQEQFFAHRDRLPGDFRGTGKLLVNEVALDKRRALRGRPGKPLMARSAYRPACAGFFRLTRGNAVAPIDPCAPSHFFGKSFILMTPGEDRRRQEPEAGHKLTTRSLS